MSHHPNMGGDAYCGHCSGVGYSPNNGYRDHHSNHGSNNGSPYNMNRHPQHGPQFYVRSPWSQMKHGAGPPPPPPPLPMHRGEDHLGSPKEMYYRGMPMPGYNQPFRPAQGPMPGPFSSGSFSDIYRKHVNFVQTPTEIRRFPGPRPGDFNQTLTPTYAYRPPERQEMPMTDGESPFRKNKQQAKRPKPRPKISKNFSHFYEDQMLDQSEE